MKMVMTVTDHKGRVWGLGEVWMVWRAAPAGASTAPLSTRLLLSLGQVWPQHWAPTCRPHLPTGVGRSYTIHGRKTPGRHELQPGTHTWSSHRIHQPLRLRHNSLFINFPLCGSPTVGLCVCIRLWGTLQQNEWLALLEKLLNIPPVLSQQSPTLDKNSTSEFFRPEIKQEKILKPFSPRKASTRKEENRIFLVNNKIMTNNDPTAPDQHLITSSSGCKPHWHFYAAVDKSKSFPENNDFSRKWL